MRKPLIPSSITIFINILIRRRTQTHDMVRLASFGLRHGMKIDVPFLKALQLISYLTPSTSIRLFRTIFGHADKRINIEEAAG